MGWQKFYRRARFMKDLRTSSGITVDAGGVTVTSGTITQTAGNMAVTAGGVDLPTAAGTTSANLPNYGLSIVGGTGLAQTFTIAAPTVGVEKFIEITNGSSSRAHVVRASTGGAVTFNGTDHIMTVTTAGDGNISFHLIGATTSRWSIQGSYGTLTFSTS